MSHIRDFIKCQQVWYDKTKGEYQFVSGFTYLNPTSLHEITVPAEKTKVGGADVVLFSVMAADGHKSLSSGFLETLLWNDK